VDFVRGANPQALEEKIKQHYVTSEASGSSASTSNSASVSGYPDITSNVDITNVRPGLKPFLI